MQTKLSNLPIDLINEKLTKENNSQVISNLSSYIKTKDENIAQIAISCLASINSEESNRVLAELITSVTPEKRKLILSGIMDSECYTKHGEAINKLIC